MKLENGMRSFFFFFFIIFFTLQPFSSLNHGYVFGERVRDVGWRKMTKQIIRMRMRANVCVCVEEDGKVLLSISTRAAAEETNRKCSSSMIYQTRPLIFS